MLSVQCSSVVWYVVFVNAKLPRKSEKGPLNQRNTPTHQSNKTTKLFRFIVRENHFNNNYVSQR